MDLIGRPSQDLSRDAKALEQNADSIRRLQKRLIEDIVEIGRLLSDSKRRLEHGEWLPWLAREFSWSERTARNFIVAYEFVRSKSVNVADLRLDVSSLYLLAAPSTPDEARAEVLDRIKAGETLSRIEIKGIVDDGKAQVSGGRSPSRMTVREVVDRSVYASFRRLLPFEREKLMALAREDLLQASDQAEMKSRLQKKYRYLLHAIEETESAARWSIAQIIETIPAEQKTAVTERVKRTLCFYRRLLNKLAPDPTSDQTPTQDHIETLDRLYIEARKKSKKAFGHINHANIVETLWHTLDPAQRNLVLDGKLGETIRIAADRFNRQQAHGQRGR